MNSTIIYNIIRFVFLLAAQVVLFNNIHLFGYVTPYPYLLYIILYPVNGNRNALLISSFFLGILMDMFMNSGGVHAAASVLLAYFRPSIFKFSFGLSYEYQTVRLDDSLNKERFTFILLAVLLHHLALFVLEIFGFTYFFDILTRTFLSSILTLIFCILLIYLFKPSRR